MHARLANVVLLSKTISVSSLPPSVPAPASLRERPPRCPGRRRGGLVAVLDEHAAAPEPEARDAAVKTGTGRQRRSESWGGPGVPQARVTGKATSGDSPKRVFARLLCGSANAETRAVTQDELPFLGRPQVGAANSGATPCAACRRWSSRCGSWRRPASLPTRLRNRRPAWRRPRPRAPPPQPGASGAVSAPAPGSAAPGHAGAEVPPPTRPSRPTAARLRSPAPRRPAGAATAARVVTEAPSAHEASFEFGSYGRVMRERSARRHRRGTNVVAFGPRIVDEAATPSSSSAARTSGATGQGARRRDARALPAVLPLHRQGTQAIGVRNLYAQGTYDKRHDVGRLAHVPRRRHLPAQLVAARQPEHGRRRLAAPDRRAGRRHETSRRSTSGSSASTTRTSSSRCRSSRPSASARSTSPSSTGRARSRRSSSRSSSARAAAPTRLQGDPLRRAPPARGGHVSAIR